MAYGVDVIRLPCLDLHPRYNQRYNFTTAAEKSTIRNTCACEG